MVSLRKRPRDSAEKRTEQGRRNPGRQSKLSPSAPDETTPQKKKKKKKQNARSRGNFPLTESETSDSDEETVYSGEASSKPCGTKTSPKGNTMTSRRKSTPRRPGSHAVAKRVGTASSGDAAPPPGGTPNWEDMRIAHSIWSDILYYAAVLPTTGHVNTTWLARAAHTCWTLADPAISILYRDVHLPYDQKAVGLAELLAKAKTPADVKFNYPAKIESITIDISYVKLAVDNIASPHSLFTSLPRLSEINLVTHLDNPPYRQLEDRLRWQYRPHIFEAIRVPKTTSNGAMYPTRLLSWQWNARMMGPECVACFDDIRQVHETPEFEHLRRVHFVNFQTPDWVEEKGIDEYESIQREKLHAEAVAKSISTLTELTRLRFEASTVLNEHLLPLLPTNLTHLELINCWEINSDNLGQFLRTHGSSIEQLTLNHNQGLNLSFLTSLAASCPQLRELRMNLLYFKLHDAYNDSQPFYKDLLLVHQVPAWPSSLQVIDLNHLRHWTTETASMFFQSLVDCAGNLPNLRHLSIKGMLNIPWRNRTEFCQTWQSRLERVFLRVSPPPAKFTSLRAIYAHTAASPPRKKTKRAKQDPSRQSQRLASQADDATSSAQSRRKTKGLRGVGCATYEEPDTDEFDNDDDDRDEDTSSDSEDARQTGLKTFAQGLCTTVEVKVDNQKLAEHQYAMNDFLDESDDDEHEEWNGQDEFV